MLTVVPLIKGRTICQPLRELIWQDRLLIHLIKTDVIDTLALLIQRTAEVSSTGPVSLEVAENVEAFLEIASGESTNVKSAMGASRAGRCVFFNGQGGETM